MQAESCPTERAGSGTPRSSSPALMLGLGFFAAVFLLAAPAQAAPGDRSGVIVAEQPDPGLAAARHEAALVRTERPLADLPFARLDLAILALGGAIVIAAASGAPLLFRPLRLTLSARLRAGTVPDPRFPTRERGGVAHAPA